MRKYFLLLCLACAYLLASPVFAGVTATSIATDVGDYFGDSLSYYRYDIKIDWETGIQQGVSHFELDLSAGLLCPYALYDIDDNPTGNIRFEDPLSYQADMGDGVYETYYYTTGIDGTSNSPDEIDPTVTNLTLWGGTIDTPDKLSVWFEQPLVDDATHPDPSPTDTSDPGATGTGVFHFYSVFSPVTGSDEIMLKADGVNVYGDLTGDLPYCVPEPATLALLGLGGLLLRKRRV